MPSQAPLPTGDEEHAQHTPTPTRPAPVHPSAPQRKAPMFYAVPKAPPLRQPDEENGLSRAEIEQGVREGTFTAPARMRLRLRAPLQPFPNPESEDRMQLTLTNLGAESEAISSPHGDWAAAIDAGATFDVTGEKDDVIVVGVKPDLVDTFEQAFQAVGEVAKKILATIVGRKKQLRDTGQGDPVKLSISNHGANPVRVILGDGVSDLTVNPGTTRMCEAEGYLELRELGNAPQQGGTPD